MARVRLQDHECRGEGLPGVCILCREPPVVLLELPFAWSPRWVLWLLPFCLLPAGILAVILCRRLTVHLPFCHRHRHTEVRRQWLHVGGSGAVIGLLIVAFNLFPLLDPRMKTLGPILGFLFLFLIFGWCALAIVLELTRIRPAEITDRSITLVNVGSAFVAALEEVRAAPGLQWDLDRSVAAHWRDRARGAQGPTRGVDREHLRAPGTDEPGDSDHRVSRQ